MDQVSKKKYPVLIPEELIGRTFIREMEDGQKLRAEIKKELLLHAENHCDIRKFLVMISAHSLGPFSISRIKVQQGTSLRLDPLE
jgi:hypothetical protein